MSISKRFSFSTLFPSFSPCRPKDPSTLVVSTFADSPVNPNPKTRDIGFPPPPPPASPIHRHVAPVVTASGCRCNPRRSHHHKRGAVADAPPWPLPLPIPTNKPITTDSPRLKIDESDDSSVFRPRPPVRRRRRPEKTKLTKKWKSRGQISSSSADSGWLSFSSEDEENDEREDDGDETDTLLSSFETDSITITACQSPERAKAVLSRLSSVVHEEKVAEGFAVVKRSKDPHGDFRRSMAEMVLEKQIYDAPALEKLLQCFLSLNSRHHHAAIVAAFADVWDAVFPTETVPIACCYK